MEAISDLIKARAMGRGQGWCGVDPARVIRDDRLSAWAEVWERIGVRKGEVIGLNLDRRSFVLETLSRLQAVAMR